MPLAVPSDLPPVLLEDNHLLAFAKPAGLAVQPDDSGDRSLLEIAREYLKIKYAKPGNVFLAPAHRLDRPVSGAVLFARTGKAASRLAQAFRNRKVTKEYHAVVVLPAAFAPSGDDEIELTDWLLPGGRGHNTRIAAAGAPGAKRAELRYRVRRTWRDVPSAPAGEARAWLAVAPRTGYKHQIRAQLAGAGMPVVGDFRYGPRGAVARPAPFLDGRGVALHAYGLRLRHPVRDETVELTASWPPSFAALVPEGFSPNEDGSGH